MGSREHFRGGHFGNLTARGYQRVALLHDDDLNPARTQSFVCRAYISRRPHLCRYDPDLQRLSCSLDLLPLRVGLWIGHIVQQPDARRAGDDFTRKLELLCRQALYIGSYSRHIAGGPGVVFSEAKENWISERGNYDWDLVGRLFESNRLDGCPSEDDIWFELNQFCCKSGQTLRMKIRIPVNHFKIPTFHVTKFSHACQKLIEKSHDEGVAFRRKP